jgi:hypothetical protein
VSNVLFGEAVDAEDYRHAVLTVHLHENVNKVVVTFGSVWKHCELSNKD